ncbi:MAG: toll/interleukin-1 receptor domain-containing protein [Verrucomicrobiota bacterium]|nr:toll/interleukin-1 receptor domain-containing protein [Verrucomicrobiota bacterium]
MAVDAFLDRIKRKARSNQLAIAISTRFSGELSLGELAASLQGEFRVTTPVQSGDWNSFVEFFETHVAREELCRYVADRASHAPIRSIHRKLASIPISNFIDATYDRGLTRALAEGGRNPILHHFSGQSIGAWHHRNPDSPNVFFVFAALQPYHHWFGLQQQLTVHPQNRIQLENMMEMLRGKDLLLLEYDASEAETVLRLDYLAQAADKVVNTRDPLSQDEYWIKRGVFIADVEAEAMIDYLMPANFRTYTAWDLPFPGRMLIDVARDKEYDSFISYFSGDRTFAERIDADLRQRGIRVWRDNAEIQIGDSITTKIEDALRESYAFCIVLSKRALERPMVKEELRAAYNLRHAHNLKILPLLFEDCHIPIFLADYKYADFREPKNYAEQLELLTRSIESAVAKARDKA